MIWFRLVGSNQRLSESKSDVLPLDEAGINRIFTKVVGKVDVAGKAGGASESRTQ